MYKIEDFKLWWEEKSVTVYVVSLEIKEVKQYGTGATLALAFIDAVVQIGFLIPEVDKDDLVISVKKEDRRYKAFLKEVKSGFTIEKEHLEDPGTALLNVFVPFLNERSRSCSVSSVITERR